MPRARKQPQALTDFGSDAAFPLPLQKRTGGAGGVDAVVMVSGRQEPMGPERAVCSKTRKAIEEKLGPVPGARAGEIYVHEPVEGDANDRKRRRSLHPLDTMLSKGMVTKGQYRAGMALSVAWESVFRTPSRGPADPKVDTSSRPDTAVVIQTEQRERYTRLFGALPNDSRDVCFHVCCMGRFLRDGYSENSREMAVHREQLIMGLSILEEVV